ncbi:MAG: FixH family protein [Bryobacteraceae bacterium]
MNRGLRLYIGLGTLVLAAMYSTACKGTQTVETKPIESQREGNLVVSLLNEKGELAQGQSRFVVWFRSVGDNKFVDVGSVTVSSSMAMPGMAPMTAPIELESAGSTGQYVGKGDFAMSGAWKFEVRWDGPAGRGVTSFNSNIR